MPKWLFATVESDWEILLNSVRSKVIRLHQYELDAIWRSYIFEFYNGLAALFFAEHLKNAAIDREMESLSLADEVFFTYSGYMDRFIKLDTWKREQKMMKYFLLKTDPQFDTSPIINRWFQKMDSRNICMGKSYHIENRQLFLLKAIQLQYSRTFCPFPPLWLQRD